MLLDATTNEKPQKCGDIVTQLEQFEERSWDIVFDPGKCPGFVTEG